MNTSNTPATPPTLSRCLCSRRASPGRPSIELAAAILEGRSNANAETVATELRLIAGALEVRS